MTQLADISVDGALSAPAWFRLKAEDAASGATAANLRKAAEAFGRFAAVRGDISFGDIDGALLRRWVMWMFGQGLALSSVSAYLAKLSALYGRAVKAGVAAPTDAFSYIKVRVGQLDAARLALVQDAGGAVFGGLRRLVQLPEGSPAELLLARDVTLLGIYAGGLTPARLASLRREEAAVLCPEAAAIAARHSSPRRRYLFALGQAERTPAQLERAVLALVREALGAARIAAGELGPHVLADLWAAVALRAGFGAGAVAACLGDVASDSIFSLAEPEDVDAGRRADIIGHTARLLGRDPDCWFAMQFRPRVTFEAVAARMEACSLRLDRTFYPMEEIRRRIGARTVAKSRPIVPGLLFFKYRASGLTGLYRAIGDLAWGYRTGRTPSSPYATISAADIEVYRTTIGQFDDTTEVFPAGTIELRPGDRVEIVGGPLIGRTAVLAEAPRGAGRTIRRLRLMGDNAIEWCVDADVRLLRKLS